MNTEILRQIRKFKYPLKNKRITRFWVSNSKQKLILLIILSASSSYQPRRRTKRKGQN